MDRRPIESHICAQPVALYQSGLNLSKIWTKLQVPKCCVRSAVTKFEEYAKFDDVKRSGESKSFSYRNLLELKRLVQGNNRLSAGKITTHLSMSLYKCTVPRYLKKLGYKYAVQIKKTMTECKA